MVQWITSMEDKFLEVAKQAAMDAGKIICKYVGKKHQYNYKIEDQSDFATQADLESEQEIVQILTQNFPDHSIIAEERGKDGKVSEYTWIIDPLDGTISFACGMPFFAVSIGLLKNNELILGVVYHPIKNDLYWAVKGKGAYLNNKRIHVNQRDNLKIANFAMDFGHKQRRPSKMDLYILPLLKNVGYAYAVGSFVMNLMLVASGVLDGMTAQAWVWDAAGGAIIVKEAGGKVTDLEGKALDWTKDRLNVVATNGLIHEQVLEVVKK